MILLVDFASLSDSFAHAAAWDGRISKLKGTLRKIVLQTA